MRAATHLHRTLALLMLLACALVAPLAWAQATGSAAAPAAVAAAAPGRVALVVGNNNYPSAPLLNPVNDARAMAAALQSAGFTVILRLDATQPVLTAAVREFGNRIKAGGAGTAGLFYFAGHGMQIKGRNFLIPVGANIEHEDEVGYQALDAQAVLDKMESAGNGINLMILDACRNNPFARSFRSNSVGLAQMEQPVGTLVAYATAPGSVASDGQATPNGNGLYTTHLLQAMKQPGVKVEEVLKQVRGAVRRESGGRQVPMEWNSLEGDFYFFPPQAVVAGSASTVLSPAAAAAPAIDPQAAIDEALWSAVKDSSSSAELFAYLNRFPAGRYAKDARGRLADLIAPAERPGATATAATPAGDTTGLAPGATGGRLSDAEVENVLRNTEQGERDRQAAITAAQARIDEIITWGDVGTDRRPANPKRNAHAFTEGDRYRYRVLDQMSERYTQDYLWRIDRIDADGSLWVNDGAQRFDARGQLRGGTDEVTGQWVDWQPVLPLATVAAQAPSENALEYAVASTVQWRDAQGRITKAALRGKLLGPQAQSIMTLAGLLETRRLDAFLDGPAVRSTGEQVRVTLNLSWWFAPGAGLPVRMAVEEREDDRLVRRTLHDVTALDIFGAAAAKAPWVKP